MAKGRHSEGLVSELRAWPLCSE